MKTITERKYINQMLPHLLSLRAKKLGVNQKDKDRWRALAREIKKELLIRYSVATDSELWNDMSYQRKKTKRHDIGKERILFDKNTNDIVDNIPNLSDAKRIWIKKTRTKLLDNFKEEENRILRELLLQKIKIYHKMPFVISGNIYFANFFLPDYKIIIEVVSEDILDGTGRAKRKERFVDLNNTGNTLIIISNSKAKNKNFVHSLIYSILQKPII